MAIPKTVPETVVFERDIVLTPTNEDLEQAILRAGHSPGDAFRCLEWLGAFIRAFQPVPDQLAYLFTTAVERAGRIDDPDQRNAYLLRYLGLVHTGRPAIASFIEVGKWLSKRPEDETRTQSILAAAAHFKISETTVRSYRDRYEDACDLAVQYSSNGHWD